jgi:hypothetical protein
MTETRIKPQIIMDDYTGGYHNRDLEKSRERLLQAKTYKDLSTICVIPTRGVIHYKVVQSWMNLMPPMNQKFIRIFVAGLEVGDAYNSAIEMILANPELSKWKYILTLEEDNIPAPDGLLKLYEDMDKVDVVGGLYWTKGESGQPMIYGNPSSIPLSFAPQIPLVDQLQICNGLGMGFNLFKLDIFKDPKVPKPYFKTCQEHIPNQGTKVMTQDLYYFENIHRLGYKVACDTRVKVGHFDVQNDIVW